jgi:hypothetical protein
VKELARVVDHDLFEWRSSFRDFLKVCMFAPRVRTNILVGLLVALH